MADAAHATLRWLGTVLGSAAIMGGREVGFPTNTYIELGITFSLQEEAAPRPGSIRRFAPSIAGAGANLACTGRGS